MPWPVKYHRMFDMTNDSHLFRTRAELTADGWYPVDGRPDEARRGGGGAALRQASMFHAFDHRAASVDRQRSTTCTSRGSAETTYRRRSKADPNCCPTRNISSSASPRRAAVREWTLGYKSRHRSTDRCPDDHRRSIPPAAAFGNTVALLSWPTPRRSRCSLAT